MSTTEKNSVIVELYDLTLTERKDDRFGRVVTTKSLDEDDLIKIAVSRRSDINATTMKAVLQLISDVAIEQLANGASVKFGLGYFNLGVTGVFIGDNAKWDSKQHSLFVSATPTAQLRDAVSVSKVDVRGMASVGLSINAVTDVTTGAQNSKFTPGGGVNVVGNKIKIEGTDAKVGIYLLSLPTNKVIPIPKTSILVNEPSKVSIILPTTLANGDYKIGISTQHTGNKTLLKEVRTFVFDSIFNVKKAV